MRMAAENAAASMPVPNAPACNVCRTRPTTRDSKIPAATSAAFRPLFDDSEVT